MPFSFIVCSFQSQDKQFQILTHMVVEEDPGHRSWATPLKHVFRGEWPTQPPLQLVEKGFLFFLSLSFQVFNHICVWCTIKSGILPSEDLKRKLPALSLSDKDFLQCQSFIVFPFQHTIRVNNSIAFLYLVLVSLAKITHLEPSGYLGSTQIAIIPVLNTSSLLPVFKGAGFL